jgi:hypothetical protein
MKLEVDSIDAVTTNGDLWDDIVIEKKS